MNLNRISLSGGPFGLITYAVQHVEAFVERQIGDAFETGWSFIVILFHKFCEAASKKMRPAV